MITKKEDFKGLTYIPNANDIAPNSNLLGNVTMIEFVIEKFEPKVLILVLGFDLYKLLEAELDANGEILDTNSIYYTLLYGSSDGRYRGLKDLIRNYIFFKFTEIDDTHYSGVGNIKEKAKGAVNVGFRDKAVLAWGEFHEHTIGNYYSLDNQNPTIIDKGYAIGRFWSNPNNEYQSLYGFLREEKEDYPGATFTKIEKINYYGV